MRNFTRKAVLAGMVAISLPLAAQADHDGGNGRTRVLKVALWGDEFYSNDPATKTAMIEQTIDSMNRHGLDFTIFAGDTKNGHSLCSDEAIGQDVETIFNSLRAPTLYTLGDNEWTDCHRTDNGPYDPLERLGYLRMFFFNKATTQGRHPIRVERQGALGQAYSENSRFVRSNVEFVAVNVPGSNNNLVVTDKQCHKNSDRTGCSTGDRG